MLLTEKKRQSIKKKNGYGGKKNDLDKQIELSCGFGELRSLGNFEESEKWNAMGEIERQEEVEDRLPKIQEEDENDLRAAISEMGENGWGQSSSPMQQETDDENLGNVELGGGEITIIEEMGGLVGEERMEFREEQVQLVRKRKKKKKKNRF